MSEQKQVTEGGAEVSSVQVGVLGRARVVGLVAAGTEDLRAILVTR